MTTCSHCGAEAERTSDAALLHAAHAGHPPSYLVADARDVPESLIDYAEACADTYADGAGRVDWESLWDRIDGAELDATGWRVDMGGEYDTPAMRKIQREVRKRRG